MSHNSSESANHCLRILPLGGLGEVGLNMLVIEYANSILIVDAGSMFPEDHMLGIDLVIPDFTYIRENIDKVKAIIVTHGHEDHIGALPFMLKEFSLPIYGTRFTVALIEAKLSEFQFSHQIPFHEIRPRQTITIPPFNIEFISVCHSIVDGVALAIQTPVGTIIHSGDFKLDFDPLDNREQVDLARFAHHGEKGVLVLLSDSTNVEREGFSLNENQVKRKLEEIFRNCEGRIIVSLFASNIQRIQHIIKLAEKLGRGVLLNGRSITTNVRIAQNLGLIKQNDFREINLNELASYPDNRILMLTTGSQGEPMSALSRIANQEHKKIKIKPGDTVILSSKFIPGNENKINKAINNLFRLGAEVIYEKVEDIHASGHANQEELKIILNITKPKYFIPIHGEYRHLVKHIQLAEKVGIHAQNAILLEDGDIVEFTEDQYHMCGQAKTGRIFVDGKGVGNVGNLILRERKSLSEDGIVIVTLVMDEATGEFLFDPEITSRGFILHHALEKIVLDAKSVILEVIDQVCTYNKEGRYDSDRIKDMLRRELRRFFRTTIGRVPIIFPIIIEI